MHRHLFNLLRGIAFGLFFQLAGCGGGGGGGADETDNTVGSGTLTVTVTTTGGKAVDGSSGYFHVEGHALVTLKCSVACTVTQSSNNGVSLSNTATQSDGWSATIDFASTSSSLDLSVRAADGSTVVIRLRPVVSVGTTATWSVGSNSWTRGGSTLNQSTSTAGSSSGLAVSSTVISNCKSSAYECSTVSVHWYGHGDGTFTIDPDFLTRQQYRSGTAWVNVKITGGTANDVIANCTPITTVTTEHYYNTDYRPTAGTIRVVRGTDGKYRVTTDVPLTVYKQPDSENRSLCIRSVAAPSAPAQANLQLNAVF